MDYEPPRFYRPGTAAELLQVDLRTLTRWADSGLIPVIVLPSGHRRYPQHAIQALLEERQAS